jgi:hypothetical protein
VAIDAVLQLGDAVAGAIVPTYEIGNSLAIAVTFLDPVTLLELQPTTVAITAYAPDGTSSALAVTAPGLGVTGVPYTAVAQLALQGTYTIRVVASTPPLTIIVDGQVNAGASSVALVVPGSSMPLFNVAAVTPSQSPFAAQSLVSANVDCRQGPVAIILPPISGAGIVPIKDLYGASASPAPAGPITYSVNAADLAGGVTVEDASNRGSYVAVGHIAESDALCVWLVPCPLLNRWIIGVGT